MVQAKAQPKMMVDEASASIALELWASTGQSVVSSADMDKNHEAEDFDANKENYYTTNRGPSDRYAPR